MQAPQVKLWRCAICSEPYIGYSPPENCPFCGAHLQWIIPAENWNRLREGDSCRLQSTHPDDIQITEKSRKNLEEALEIEISNATFYLCVSKASKDPFIQGMFKILSNIEKEHASLHARLLKAPKPAIELDQKLCAAIDRKSVEESLRRETSAVAHYGKFLGEANEPRLRQIFKALVDIEGDHIQLDRDVLERMR